MKTILNLFIVSSFVSLTTLAKADDFSSASPFPPLPNLKLLDIQNQLDSNIYVKDSTAGEKSKDGMPAEVEAGQIARGYFGDHGTIVFYTSDKRSCTLEADYEGVMNGEIQVVSSSGLTCTLVGEGFAGTFQLFIQ